ncbi:TPA: peptidase domain-containing ABC transporter [Acinetobacter baumannii]|nr:peptidase domain-containing ABC transporter [Acinetobacter baumannii]
MSVLSNLKFTFGQKLSVILQTESSECGLACLAMICSYYGNHVNLFNLRQTYSISLKGATLNDLIKISKKLNLSSRPLRVELNELKQLRLPCIVHINMDHFVVLKEVTKKKVIIVDPAIGLQAFDYNDFSKIFTGIALELWPAADFEYKEQVKTFKIFSLIRNLKSFYPSFFYIFILAVVLEIFNLLSPLYMQFVLDNAIPEGDNQLLITLTVAFSLFLVINIVLTTTQALLGQFISTTLSVQWKFNILDHLVNLPSDYFFKRHLGDILSRFGSIEPIQSTLTSTFIITFLNACMAICTFALMCYMSFKLAIISLISLSLYLIVRIFSYIPLRNLMERGIIHSAKQNTYLMETLRGIRIVKQFNKQNSRSRNWLSLYVNQINNSLQTQNLNISINVLYKLIFGIESLIIVFLGASAVIDKTFTIGFLMAFIAYKTQFASRFASLIDSYIQIKMLSLHGERLSDIVLSDQESDFMLDLPHKVQTEIKGKITVKNLGFKYGEMEPEILNDISFTIEPGQSVSLTGPSGEGKSTLMNLLNSSLKPTNGEILIDDISLSQLGSNNLRSIIACVNQDDTLFAGNIMENISFFDEYANEDWIIECAKMAGIHEEIIKMPMGYYSLVGDMGSTLSGGQKQRIFIARALYKKPKILFLDEATSHLDIKRERIINSTISKMDITRIIIAHRKETIFSSERIISLSNGKISQDRILGNEEKFISD